MTTSVDDDITPEETDTREVAEIDINLNDENNTTSQFWNVEANPAEQIEIYHGVYLSRTLVFIF